MQTCREELTVRLGCNVSQLTTQQLLGGVSLVEMWQWAQLGLWWGRAPNSERPCLGRVTEVT